MKLLEVTNYNLKSQTILNESWDMLTESQRLYVGAWEKNIWPLMEQLNVLLEAELTADQIQQIFANAEKVSIEGGDNLTALGKAGKVTSEVSSKMKAEIEKLLKAAQNSGPIKNMDAQFDKLRSQLATKVSKMSGGQKILAGVDKWKTFAEENPAKSAFIIGAMTSVLAFASGGIMSGAAIGFFLRLANNTIKGDKLSTAVGKAVKTAAIGAVAGALGDIMSDNIEMTDPEVQDGKVVGDSSVKSEVSSKELAKGADGESVSAEIADMSPEEYKLEYAKRIAERYENMNGGMSDAMIQKIADNVVINGNYPDNFKATFDGTVVRGNIYLTPDEVRAWNSFVNPDDPFAPNGTLGKETTEWLKNNVEGAKEHFDAQAAEQAAADAELKAKYDAMSPEEQKAFDDKRRDMEAMWGDPNDYTPPGTPKYAQESIEEQLWQALEQYELQEAPNFMAALGGAAKGIGKVAGKAADTIGKAAAKGASAAGGAIAKGAKAVGKELGQKITVRKLNKMWDEEGNPTDTGRIAAILAKAGLTDEQIGTIAQDNNVDLTPSKEPAANTDVGKVSDMNADGKDDSTGKPVPRNPKIKVAKGAGQVATASDGDSYVWAGQQWVNNKTARVATKQVAAELGNPNLKLLADKIKQADVADLVKQVLSKPAAPAAT